MVSQNPRHMSCRIFAGAVADHEIKQYDSHRRITQCLTQRIVANRGINHWVRAPTGILIITKIQQRMPGSDFTERMRALDRGIRGNPYSLIKKNHLRFGCKRTAREKTTNPLAVAG